MSSISAKSTTSSSEDENELRRGPWTVEEDNLLVDYIANHGEGRWNLLAKLSGLRRTGKSCRLRWLNYLKPDVKRGNLSPEEQLLILDLHSKWGNRWSKIAQYLPGRTDNEIKNYWRTRVQKQAKHLKIDTESSAFQDIIRRYWMPRLLQKIESCSSFNPSTFPIQNPTNPLPNIDNSSQQYYSTSAATLSSIPPPQISGHEIPQISSESMDISHISQFSEYPNCPFQPMLVNNDHSYTFAEGYTNDGDSISYDIDALSQAAEGQFGNCPVGDCHMAASDWTANDFSVGMWNMGEIWRN
ncbi:hypothetical protein UlMin_008582 [Ulmus minor]